MEKPEYRLVLEDILAYSAENCGGRRLLTAKDVAGYTSRTERFVVKAYSIPKEGIMAPVLAHRMCR